MPPQLVDAIAEAKKLADRGSPVLDQLAFADFLDTRRVRSPPAPDAARCTGAAATRCCTPSASRLPELEPAGIAAGLHLVAYLPDDVDETAVVAAAAARGLPLYGLAPYRVDRAGRPGLIFGYATLDERTITEGIDVLADVITRTGRRP